MSNIDTKLHKNISYGNYMFLKNQLLAISNELIFMKDYIINISNNLINMHKLKLYDGLYLSLDEKLKEIYNKIKIYPDFIKVSYLKKHDIKDLVKEINDIKIDLINITNKISPSDIRIILHLLFGSNWLSFFNYNEIINLGLLSRLFIPISVWDSLYHIESEKTIIKKRTPFTSEIQIPLNDESSSIIVGDMNVFPMFIKSLSELVLKDKNIIKQDRIFNYNYNDLLGLFNNNTEIIFMKNTNNDSLIEEKNGFNIGIKVNNRIIIIQGYCNDDTMNLYKTNNFINSKYNKIEKFVNKDSLILDTFKNNYLNIINIKDILINTPEEYYNKLKKIYNDYVFLKTRTLNNIMNDFVLASKYRKYEYLIMLMCGNDEDNKLAYLLYDYLKIKDKKDSMIELYNSLPSLFKIKLNEVEELVNKEEDNIIKNHIGELSYERRINILKIDNSIKDKAIEKLKSMKGNFQGDNKAQSWLDGFLKIPFGIYRENKLMNFKKNFMKKLNINMSTEQINNYIKDNSLLIKEEWNNYNIEKSKYLKMIHNKLDESVYGHKEAKNQLEKLFAQWINGETNGAIIGLHGPPGTGKTSLAKNGLSKCLIDDDNIPRPFAFLPIGGSVNGSTLAGHNYTYMGSTWGRIADILMTSKCMNPIIFIDEVDKISNTEYGKEITAILTHLTDSTQNDNFEDKYFNGIPLDLSKALIVFSFNDINMIDPILRDRITIIETKPYTLPDKIQIIKDYILPTTLKDVGFDKDEIIFNNDIITYLIDTYTNEAGVRKIKEKIIDIARDINLKYMHNPTDIKLPIIISKEYIDDLFKNKPKMRINMIHKNPEVGLVNGLYATTTGIGGLTVIQVMKYPSDKMLDLTLTGQQGDVMKESVSYALRIAYSLLTDDEKNKILEDASNKKHFGLLVHTPEAATKKDGPSAGAAMSLAIYSVLTGKKIKNNVAMTGEIDLCKNVRAIGGVYAKLYGAKAAGVKLALIPKENLDDLNILRNENISPEDDSFKVELIETFDDVLKYCL
jgi:ATP-dependent Lon protease